MHPLLNYFRLFFAAIHSSIRHFKLHKGSQLAAALSYSTLLSIVPMTALLFFISMQFEMFSSLFDQVRQQALLFLLPNIRVQVETYLLHTTTNIRSFSYISIAIIFLSAIWLSLGVERALNHIWKVLVPRHLALRIPAHMTLWLFAPVLIMLSISVSTWLTSLPYLENFNQPISYITRLFPWLISSIALFLLYYFVPNTAVQFNHASFSALVAGLLFELSKWAFALYITKFAIYEKLYGALATLPIFMLWIYIAWVIVLWGASFCVALQSNKDTGDFLG